MGTSSSLSSSPSPPSPVLRFASLVAFPLPPRAPPLPSLLGPFAILLLLRVAPPSPPLPSSSSSLSRESPPVPRFPRLSPPLRRPSLYPHPLCAFSFPPLLHRCRLRRLRRCLCPCLRPPRLACRRPVSPRPRHRLGRCLPVHRVPCCWWHRRWLPLYPYPPCPSRLSGANGPPSSPSPPSPSPSPSLPP